MASSAWKERWLWVRGHLCTLSVAMSAHAWIRVPAGAFRHGALAYGLALSAAAVAVAAPAVLLHLAVGQLCQQGVVGMWRAVPFFTGVGYLRLLITYLSSVYTIVYLALILMNFFYTLNADDTFRECAELIVSEETSENNSSVLRSSVLCYTENLMAEVTDEPGYYTALALLVVALWIVMPFLLYNPLKYMKRMFCVLGPLVLVLSVAIMSCVGSWSNLASFHQMSDWKSLRSPDFWFAAVTQALFSTQVAGGFLVSAGDALYSHTNVQWTSLLLVGANIVSSWLGLLFWFLIGGRGPNEADPLAIISQVYYVAEEKLLIKIWPLLIFFTLALSAVITIVINLYPVYERLMCLCGERWRVAAAGGSALGLALALGALGARAAGQPALPLCDEVALPLLVGLATLVEVAVFFFIYGWKVVVEDIEFLTGGALSKCWVVGWAVCAAVVAATLTWWVAAAATAGWAASAVAALAAAALALLVLAIGAALAVARQLHYDCFSKLSSSFAPSRRWGPRDPITHYYWVRRREQAGRGESRAAARARYSARAVVAAAAPPAAPPSKPSPLSLRAAADRHDRNKRSHSDDWFYTLFRKQFLKDSGREQPNKKRSKSLDLDPIKHISIHKVKRDLKRIVDFYKEKENNISTIT